MNIGLDSNKCKGKGHCLRRLHRGISLLTGQYIYGYLQVINHKAYIKDIDAIDGNIALENEEVDAISICSCLGKYVKDVNSKQHLLFETDSVSFPQYDFVGKLLYCEEFGYWYFNEVDVRHNIILGGKQIKLSDLSDYDLSVAYCVY